MPDPGLILAGGGPIAEFLGVRPAQARYWAKAGLIPTFKIGDTICADRQALLQWLAQRQTVAMARVRNVEAA